MASQVLGKLSLIELAPITTTCSSFRAYYRERMAQAQDARHQRAVNRFGPKRIAGLCAFIVRLLKGEPLGPAIVSYRMNHCWISGDGVLHERGCSPQPPAPQDIRVNFEPRYSSVLVQADDDGPYWLTIRVGHRGKRVGIDVRDDESFMPAALMQALLSGGLARSILDLGFRAKVIAGRSGVQIAPLLPFASRYIPAKTTSWGYVREHMLIGVAAE